MVEQAEKTINNVVDELFFDLAMVNPKIQFFQIKQQKN
jgi:hypothetical protein